MLSLCKQYLILFFFICCFNYFLLIFLVGAFSRLGRSNSCFFTLLGSSTFKNFHIDIATLVNHDEQVGVY